MKNNVYINILDSSYYKEITNKQDYHSALGI
jgi:hypothetical protein